MRRVIAMAFAAALMCVAASTTVHADATADCAKIEGKALATLFKGLFKEAIKACGGGAATMSRPASHQAAGAATGKFATDAGKAVDTIGSAPCPFDIDDLTAQNVLDSMQQFANQACLVP
jgi:hypothetical protein